MRLFFAFIKMLDNCPIRNKDISIIVRLRHTFQKFLFMNIIILLTNVIECIFGTINKRFFLSVFFFFWGGLFTVLFHFPSFRQIIIPLYDQDILFCSQYRKFRCILIYLPTLILTPPERHFSLLII